jgi:hypothetical protein
MQFTSTANNNVLKHGTFFSINLKNIVAKTALEKQKTLVKNKTTFSYGTIKNVVSLYTSRLVVQIRFLEGKLNFYCS